MLGSETIIDQESPDARFGRDPGHHGPMRGDRTDHITASMEIEQHPTPIDVRSFDPLSRNAPRIYGFAQRSFRYLRGRNHRLHALSHGRNVHLFFARTQCALFAQSSHNGLMSFTRH